MGDFEEILFEELGEYEYNLLTEISDFIDQAGTPNSQHESEVMAVLSNYVKYNNKLQSILYRFSYKKNSQLTLYNIRKAQVLDDLKFEGVKYATERNDSIWKDTELQHIQNNINKYEAIYDLLHGKMFLLVNIIKLYQR